MAVLLEDREAARPLLMRDRIRNAVVIERMFDHPDFTLAFADQLPEPKAVLALHPAETSDSPHQFALHALEPLAALHVLKTVPKGSCIYHVADEHAFPSIRQALGVGWWGEAILYRIEEKDFVDVQAHEVEPLDPTHAAKIAKIWAPDWPAENYVRSRIGKGLNGAIYEDGEPVAWYLTHLETDDVVMLGFLHVLEPYRGRGYATSLSCALIKQSFAKGKSPCCHVYTDNEPSIRLMEGLGFRRVCLQAWGDGIVRA
ncbi:MAG TPA: GNAT family N-acetyltransferase [Thermoplasmata archaeon]|nr:GNAT family N-acetyltransferase [Thermoplasmata archaeon]